MTRLRETPAEAKMRVKREGIEKKHAAIQCEINDIVAHFDPTTRIRLLAAVEAGEERFLFHFTQALKTIE